MTGHEEGWHGSIDIVLSTSFVDKNAAAKGRSEEKKKANYVESKVFFFFYKYFKEVST